ncbi:MAG TPA: transporter associated domain-containing protein, partial [Microbacterium sp.]|nr:transporter associated domain-containing protein [Microbacterium sp.]
DGCWVLSGLLRPDEVQRATEIRLPEDEDYETVAGLVADRLARMPEPGDAVQLPARDRDEAERDVRLTVLAMDGLRVDRIRLEVLEGSER